MQLVNASDCGSEDRGFESHYPPFFLLMGYRQVVRHSTLTAAFAGSSPASPVLDNFIRVCSSGGRALDF